MEDSAHLADLLRSLEHPHVDLLAEAVDGGAARIEEHPLGMYACRGLAPNGDELRLHLWTPDSSKFRDELGQIHDHTWDLESTILRGRLRNHTISLTDHNLEFDLWEHDYEARALTNTGRKVGIHLQTHEAANEGERYGLPSGRFHLTERLTPSLLTIVRARSSHLTIARILQPLGSRPTSTTVRRIVSPAALSYALADVLAP